jgi:hypothetical protein
MCDLGNARVFLKLVRERVKLAARSQRDLLTPALEDLGQIEALLRQVQSQIKLQIEKELRNEN